MACRKQFHRPFQNHIEKIGGVALPDEIDMGRELLGISGCQKRFEALRLHVAKQVQIPDDIPVCVAHLDPASCFYDVVTLQIDQYQCMNYQPFFNVLILDKPIH